MELEGGRVTPIRSLVHAPFEDAETFRSASFSFAQDGQIVFYVTNIDEQPSQLTMAMIRSGEVPTRVNPFDQSRWLGVLSCAPDGPSMTLRVGNREPGACRPFSTGKKCDWHRSFPTTRRG